MSIPQRHLLGHLGAPDPDFIDFGYVLGASLGSLWAPFGNKFLILDVQMACGIQNSISIDLIRKTCFIWEVVCAENIINTMVFMTFSVRSYRFRCHFQSSGIHFGRFLEGFWVHFVTF